MMTEHYEEKRRHDELIAAIKAPRPYWERESIAGVEILLTLVCIELLVALVMLALYAWTH